MLAAIHVGLRGTEDHLARSTEFRRPRCRQREAASRDPSIQVGRSPGRSGMATPESRRSRDPSVVLGSHSAVHGGISCGADRSAMTRREVGHNRRLRSAHAPDHVPYRSKRQTPVGFQRRPLGTRPRCGWPVLGPLIGAKLPTRNRRGPAPNPDTGNRSRCQSVPNRGSGRVTSCEPVNSRPAATVSAAAVLRFECSDTLRLAPRSTNRWARLGRTTSRGARRPDAP